MPTSDENTCPAYLDSLCAEREPWVSDSDALRSQSKEMCDALTGLPDTLTEGVSVFADALSISCYLPLSSACDLLTVLHKDLSFGFLVREVEKKGAQESAEVLEARAKTLFSLGYFERVYGMENRSYLKEAIAKTA